MQQTMTLSAGAKLGTVSADGQCFLMSVTTNEQVTNPITMILNWHPKP